MEYITIILVAALAALAVGMLTRYRCEANAERRLARERDEANAKVEQARQDCDRRVDALKLEHRQEMERERARWQQDLATQVSALQGQMSGHFEREMKERSQAFKSENHEQMENILKPMRQELERLQKLMDSNTTSQTERISMLKQSIETLARHDNERDKTTRDLANALKNRGKVQGDWGEQVLESILRDSGLREGHDYEVQQNVRTQDGQNLRPDVVVHFPNGEAVVIDSKVSLTAYTDYVGAESEEERQAAARANRDSIWSHVCELAEKRYPQLVSGAAPLVLMFVPNEGSYILAMNTDQKLGNNAWRKGVLIINPTNLLMVLHLVSLSWQSARQDKNVRDILKAAQGIYEKYTSFAATFSALGKHLTAAQDDFDKGMGQLREGKGNLSGQMQTLLRLGVNSPKTLPDELQPLDDSPLS